MEGWHSVSKTITHPLPTLSKNVIEPINSGSPCLHPLHSSILSVQEILKKMNHFTEILPKVSSAVVSVYPLISIENTDWITKEMSVLFALFSHSTGTYVNVLIQETFHGEKF